MQTFTLEEAAALIANKYGWHEGAHATLVERLLDATRDGSLTVRDPHTDLPYRPKQYRYHWEKVSAADLNRYFDGVGAPWRADNDGEAADPLFDTEWWNPSQVLTWVYLGDRTLVKEGAIVNQDARFQLKLKAADRQGARYSSVNAAEKATVEALQTGKLTAYGLKNGGGDLTEIPSQQWADLECREDSDHAGPGDCFRPMVNRWVTLRFKRKAVLAVWPDPFESLAMADKPGAAKADRGRAANEPIAKRKAPDIFIGALNDLIAEIIKRAAEKGMRFDLTKMPGKKADFRALAEKYDDKLERAERTFNDYLVGVLRFKRGARETAFYRDLFPEYF